MLMAIVFLQNTNKTIAQGMAVNTSGAAANNSAMLDVSSTTQGMLVPRMDSAQRSMISSPATGLLVYQTNGLTPGFYFYNGSVWTSLSSGSATPTGAAGGNLGGTYPNPMIASLPAISGANLTSLNAGNISSGTVGTARLGSGTASSTSFLRGDGTWNAPFTLTTTGSGAATFSGGTLNIPTPSGGGGSGPSTELIAYHNAGTTLSPTTNVAVSFGATITAPTIGSFDGTTYTAGASGYYAITVSIVGATSALTALGVRIIANGTVYYGPTGTASANQNPQSRVGYSILIPISSGNSVAVYTYNFSTSNTGSLSTSGSTQITIVKL